MTQQEQNRLWLERWEQGDTGWHHEETNPHLLAFWPSLAIEPGARVAVPLCGKSRDMVWLADHGYRVVGIELSPLAVAAFFAEQGLRPECRSVGALESWRAGPYEILCGDIFQLEPRHLDGVSALYDRASLVALDGEQRAAYAALLARLLPAGTRMLVVAMEYHQGEMAGPPFSVAQSEVESLFAEAFTVTLLDSLDLLRDTERYAGLGLSRMVEQIYRLQRR